MTWKSSAYLLGQSVGKRATKKLSRTDHQRSVGEMRQSPRYIRDLPSLLRSERTKWFLREGERERDRSICEVGEGAQKMRSRNEAAERPLRGRALKMKTFRWRYDSI